MRFTIKREEFLKGLNIASRAISSKNAKPVLENFRLDLDERGLFITGTDENISIKTQVPYKLGEMDVIRNYKEGSVLIKAKLLVEMIRKMDSDEITLDVVDTTIATISSNSNNRSEYTLNCVKVDEYPDLDLEANGTQLTLARADFDILVSQTTFAASLKEQRPILTALNLEASNGILTATATDSARMARKTLSIPLGIEFVANVPAKMMNEINHLLEGRESVDIAFSDKKALFTIGTTIVATRLIAGDYPNTKNIVPKMTNYSLEVNANDFVKAIERANILSLDRENIVDLSMSEEAVEISAKSSQVGSAVERIDAFRYVGQNLHISFNSSFVIDAIKALGSADVTFAFVGEMKPFIVENASDDSVVQIVTPVRTY